MPLHLLGKKSWNVYSPANIARVRRDEEAARAREEAEEQRIQTADAARRLAILRGEVPPPLEELETHALPPPQGYDYDSYGSTGSRRKRKRHGEDDTEFEMRLAKERVLAGAPAAHNLPPKPITTPASLVDSKGHLTLFEPEVTRPREPNEEATRDAARKEREIQEQYQMRFVNAAGRDGQGLTDGGPWYASADGESSAALVPSKNVFGREDPGRKVREAARLDKSDPLAIMKKGAARVRELEKERRREKEERKREVRRMERDERRERKRRRAEGERGERRSSVDSEPECSRRRRSDEDRYRGRSEERDRGGRERRDTDADRRERSGRNREDRHRDRSRERERRRAEHEDDRRHRRDDGGHHRSPRERPR
ncbi:hypothetical protein VTI74DRAFT_7050 [Chaetomium olivicolor]